jgi:hypothetical protein
MSWLQKSALENMQGKLWLNFQQIFLAHFLTDEFNFAGLGYFNEMHCFDDQLNLLFDSGISEPSSNIPRTHLMLFNVYRLVERSESGMRESPYHANVSSMTMDYGESGVFQFLKDDAYTIKTAIARLIRIIHVYDPN